MFQMTDCDFLSHFVHIFTLVFFQGIIYLKKVIGKDLRINLRRRNTTIVAMDAISFRQDPKVSSTFFNL